LSQEIESLQRQAKELEQRLREARARIPKHDIPSGLMAEIDEMEEELGRLRAPKSVKEQIAELEERLQEARARIPKHTPPAGLMAEIDEIEEELAKLRSLPQA
jgi:DNA repair exonuclease SbcCD ATPase subunit